MKFSIQTIADSINFQDIDYIDLYPGYSDKDTVKDRKEYSHDYYFKSKKKFIEYANYIIGLFDSFPDEFPIYRAIRVKSTDDIKMDDLGESWSFDLESAKQFGYHNGSNFILSAIVNSENVDWYESMYRYLRFSDGNDSDDENEIVVIDTNELKNITISKIKETKEIGENPIFTRIPNVKSFESWLHNIIYTDMKHLKTFEEILFEPNRIKRFSDIAMSKSEVKNRFGDLIKQLQELVLHLFDKNEEPEIKCKIVSTFDEEKQDWVDGLELPDGEFSRIDLKNLTELLKQRKKILPCKIRFTDDKGGKVKEPVVNGYIKFLHPKMNKQNEPSMPWENKTENQ